jgi:DNA-binding response OmpR family regulator
MTDTDIIYIEDDDTVAQIFALGFRKYHLNTLHIPDARRETLTVLDTPRYRQARAVFFDLNICGVDGLEVARQLRTQGDDRMFFLVTAAENPNPALLEQYTIHYLRKPFNVQVVADMVLTPVAK